MTWYDIAALVVLVGCSQGGSSTAKSPVVTAAPATGSATRAGPVGGGGPSISPWPAPTSSPEIVPAQSKFGSVGKTLLTWASATNAVGVAIDYVIEYTPAVGFTVPPSQRAIQIDLRVLNAGSQPLPLTGWSVYADINNEPLTAVKDSNFVDIATLPAVAPNSSGYIPARVLIPSAGGTLLIGVTNPGFPQQPATFAVALS